MASRNDEPQEGAFDSLGDESSGPMAGILSDLLKTEPMPDILSGLLESEGLSPGDSTPEPAGIPDPAGLELESQPPEPTPAGLPESLRIDELLHELVAAPEDGMDREEARTDLQFLRRPAAETPPVPAMAELTGTTPLAVEPETIQWGADPPEPAFREPAEAAGAYDGEPAAAEAPEQAPVSAVESEPAFPGQGVLTELDALVAEIDQETGDAFRNAQQFTSEVERPAKEAQGGTSCIVFLLDGTRYALPIRNVLETDTMPRITAVPNVPPFVRGVTNVRGEIISVLDLRSLFGMERWEFAERGRILIIRAADQQTAAVAVDEVRGTASLPLGGIRPPAGPIHDKVMSVLLGVGEYEDQVLNVLDVDKIFRMPEIQQVTAN